MAQEEQGQATEQPQDVYEQASTIAQGILQSEEGEQSEKPRDDKGRFAKAQPETEVQAPAEEVKEEAPQEQEETPTEEQVQAEIRKHKLKVKSEEGEDLEVEVDDEELKRGYMMERDYRRKTSLINRERESLQAEIKKATETKLKEYDEKLQLAEQAIWHTLAPEMQGIDWNKLAQEDPAEWARKYQHVQNVNAKLAQIQQERKKLAEEHEKESKAEIRKKVEESVETLKAEVPGWNDDLYRKILNAGVGQGFKAEEVNAIIDPRAIKVLWKAMRYDELQKAKPSVEKRAAPQTPKVVKPGSGERSATSDQWNEKMAKLQKSGRTEDAVELAKLMFAGER